MLLLASGLAVLGVGIALSEWKPPLALDGLHTKAVRLVLFDFLEGLRRARVSLEFADGTRGCPRQGDMFVCPDKDGDPDIDSYVASYPVTIKEYTMRRCIRARPVQDALLSVNYPRVKVGQALVGYFGVEHAGRLLLKRRPVSFSILFNGTAVFTQETQMDTLMHWFNIPMAEKTGDRRVDIAFTIKAANASKRYFCFDAQMVDF